MDAALFTQEPATLSELADRWDCEVTQLLYIARSREIPHVKVVGGTRLFDDNQQKNLHAILRRYPVDEDANVLRAPRRPTLEEEQDNQFRRLHEKIATLEAQVAELAQVKAELAELKANVAVLMRRALEPVVR